MPLINNFESFAKTMRDIHKIAANNVRDVAIEVENDLYSKSNTLNILKDFNINLLKVKKIVSLNQDGKFVIDSGVLDNNLFISNQPLSEDDKNLFQKNQLIFVEDETNNTKINVYKILFDESEDEIRPEFQLCGNMSLLNFNEIFLNSGLFKEDNNLINQKINTLLANPDFGNSFTESVWDVEHVSFNGYYSNTTMFKDFKKHLQLNNVEEDYCIYRQGNEIILQNVTNANDIFRISINAENITNNDIFYLNKKINNNGETIWEIYKIVSTVVPDWLYNNIRYQAYAINSLTEQQFNELKALNFPSQLGFTVDATNNNGLASILKEEQQTINVVAINFLVKLEDEISEPLPFTNNISETLQNNNIDIECSYSLEIENNKIKMKNINFNSNQEKLIFEQEFSREMEEDLWNRVSVNDKYQKVYFVKTADGDFVQKLIITNDPVQVQCIEKISLAELRKRFANNNLFPTTFNGIHCGENGTQVAVARSLSEQVTEPISSVPKLPPAIVEGVINLKWNDAIELWDLNITTSNEILDKKLKLDENENNILQKLINKNNNANTVILFNKCDGKFLRAYYLDENNQKVNCSNKLSDEDKVQLNTINQKAKSRASAVRIVKPIFSTSRLLKNKTFNLSFVNKEWYVLCLDELQMEVEAKIKLSVEENSMLSDLVKGAINFSFTIDNKNNFKSISYTDHVKESNVTNYRKDLSDSKTFNGKLTETTDLINKIVKALENPNTLIPDDDGVTPKLWNSNIATNINKTTLPSSTIQTSQPQM